MEAAESELLIEVVVIVFSANAKGVNAAKIWRADIPAVSSRSAVIASIRVRVGMLSGSVDPRIRHGRVFKCFCVLHIYMT